MLKTSRKPPEPQPAPSAARIKKPTSHPGERMLLNNISWQQYEMMLELFAEQRLFMTYDDGQLELSMPLQEHEEAAEFLNGIINAIVILMGIKIKSLGSTTFRSKRMQKGLEPDKCYYVQNVEKVLSKRRVDLLVDPPPDLAIEIENTRSLIPRLPIYRQLGIPELWRYNGKTFAISILDAGRYAPVKTSQAFPRLTSKLLLKWIKLGEAKGYTEMLQTVKQWCGKQN